MRNFEAECIERYFLAPGSTGPIGSVYVADEDLLDIFGVTDLEQARKQLIRNLPHIDILRQRFSGATAPLKGRAPDYVRILVFLCWMQTTKTRQRGDRDFRDDILAKQLGENFKGASMVGLDLMWGHLKEFLWREHGIDLVLPENVPHHIRRIGRTLQMAFPTWRDRAALRKLRQFIPQERLLDPLFVANRIHTSRYILGDTMQSFEYNFEKFDDARKRGVREYMETPFWQAWYSIVAEQAALEDIEVAEGDFGEHELFRVSPLGDRVPISTPEEALKFIPKPLGKLVRNGVVFLENLGFGRYRAGTSPSNILLMKSSKLAECDSDAIRSVAGLNAGWVVANFRNQVGGGAQTQSTPREFGWRDGIRVGGAYLGRTPLAPMIAGPMPAAIRVEKNGKPIDMVRRDDGLSFKDGIHSGTFVARSHRENREILLVPRANEVGDIRRLSFDCSREISEDEFHHGTAPSLVSTVEEWSGERTPPCDELVTIGEALYERTARGLSFSEAIEIVLKGMPEDDCPSEWDLLRSFSDAGWLEMTLLRHFPVRRILQNPLAAERVGSDLVRISGPTPIAVVERLHAAASAAGAKVETWNGLSKWALARYAVRCPNERVRQDFIGRMAIAEKPTPKLALADVGNPDGVHGYQVIGRLDEERGFFAVRYDDSVTDGLYRLERKESRNPFLYRSVIDGKPVQTYVSPSVAILSHHLRAGGPLFLHRDGILEPRRSRVLLPSSWARWASDRVLCNAAPGFSEGGWRYQYAIGASSLLPISRLVPVTEQEDEEEAKGTEWIYRFLASASNRGRAIHDSRSRTTRIARVMAEKR
ncbi:hypothetical protein SJ05684_c11050 [Sinorhizobium sojae CCBAU 05684]|uniref:Uncharacterized protein n=1 Tax=Sinorhizobium sojae CCBAU 05684 TaxID=716928 RepID=A0A249P9G4_9HYPH|nr:hypothetical protein [Sinorhizobium sojae]ASY62561.1 hypothetical protein SJ05684_c11050 [Sinorhizobium sojae CCBAU 05684]